MISVPKKFSYGVANSVLKVSSTLKGDIVFLTKNTGFSCQKAVFLYKEGTTKKIFDECSLKKEGIPLIHIVSYTVFPKKIAISYIPYMQNAQGEFILETTKKSQKILSF